MATVEKKHAEDSPFQAGRERVVHEKQERRRTQRDSNGQPTVYMMVCGHCERVLTEPKKGKPIEIEVWLDAGKYHVRAYDKNSRKRLFWVLLQLKNEAFQLQREMKKLFEALQNTGYESHIEEVAKAINDEWVDYGSYLIRGELVRVKDKYWKLGILDKAE